MDTRKDSMKTEENVNLPGSTASSAPRVTQLLQDNGYENLDDFMHKNAYQKALLRKDGECAYYHPAKLEEKLSLFFSGKNSIKNTSPPVFKTPSPLKKD